MNEFLTTLRSIHLLYIAVSLAIGAFALSPRDTQLFRAAEQEANLLAQLNFDTFSNVALEVRQEALRIHGAQIVESLKKQAYSIKISDLAQEKISAPLLVWWPKKNDSIARIREFIDNPEHRLLGARFIDGRDSRGIWREVFGDAQHNALCYAHGDETDTGTITSLKTCSPLQPGGELTEVAIEELYTGPPAKMQMENWSHRLSLDKAAPGTFTFVFSVKTKDATIRYAMPEYVIGPVDAIGKRPNLACLWLLNRKKEASPIMDDSSDSLKATNLLKISAEPRSPTSRCFSIGASAPGSYFKRLFPNLDSLWSQISKLTPEEAAEQLSMKSMQSRQSMSIAGFSVDERILSIAGPVAILSMSMYLLVNLVMLRTTLTNGHHRLQTLPSYPWFCLYKDRLSSLLTVLTVLLLPVSVLLALLVKTQEQWNASSVFGHAVLLFTVFCGYRSLQTLADIRAHEAPGPTFTVQYTYPTWQGQNSNSR